MGSLYIVCVFSRSHLFASSLIVQNFRVRAYLIRWIAGMVAVACCLGPWVRHGLAQDAGDGQQEEKKWREDAFEKVQLPQRMSILSRGTFADTEEEKLFVDFYTKALFPRMTQKKYWGRQPWIGGKGPDMSADLVNMIRNDLKKASESRDNQQVFQRLSEIALESMSKLAKGADYHPATRYNAMLVISELTIPEAIPILLDTVKDPKQLEAVKVAAMLGLISQAGHGSISDADAQRQVTDAMLTIAARPVPKDDRADGVCWIKGQAAQVLGLLGSPGRDNNVVVALQNMAGDKSLPYTQRCYAAQALGKLNYGGATVPAAACLQTLAGLADDILQSEKNEPNRRQLLGDVQYLSVGTKAIAALAKTAPEQQLAETLQDNVLDPLQKSLIDPRGTQDTIAKAIDDAINALASVVKKASK